MSDDETRTCIIYGDGERVVLRGGEIDELLERGAERRGPNSLPDPLRVAKEIKGDSKNEH